MDNAVYMDHNATTPIRAEAADAMAAALAATGNPSSVHQFGRIGRRTVDEARETVSAMIGAGGGFDVVFTSGGTEANNLALKGCGRERILVSAVEHPSVLQASADPRVIPVDRNGVIDLAALDHLLASDAEPALVSVMLANNETGVIQPVADAARIARRYGALMHCDAVQAAGKIAVDIESLGVHMLSLSAHKIGGPLGAGALIVAADVPLEAQILGGGQERGLRAGTENVPALAGFGAAARAVHAGVDAFARLSVLRDRLEGWLKEVAPSVRIVGSDAVRLPNTSCFTLEGASAEVQVMALDLAGVAVSSGSACSSGRVAKSSVLEAMGVPDADCAIRVSLGWTSDENDLDRFLDAWGALYARIGSDNVVAA